jgi:hypothetical protein
MDLMISCLYLVENTQMGFGSLAENLQPKGLTGWLVWLRLGLRLFSQTSGTRKGVGSSAVANYVNSLVTIHKKIKIPKPPATENPSPAI